MNDVHLLINSLDDEAYYIPMDSIKFITTNKKGQTVIFSDAIGFVTTKTPLKKVIKLVWD